MQEIQIQNWLVLFYWCYLSTKTESFQWLLWIHSLTCSHLFFTEKNRKESLFFQRMMCHKKKRDRSSIAIKQKELIIFHPRKTYQDASLNIFLLCSLFNFADEFSLALFCNSSKLLIQCAACFYKFVDTFSYPFWFDGKFNHKSSWRWSKAEWKGF